VQLGLNLKDLMVLNKLGGICPVIDSPRVCGLVKGLYIAVKKVN